MFLNFFSRWPLGVFLIETFSMFPGKHSVRRQAIEQFRNSAMYARNAGNYDLVMTAARHYWNAIIPLVSQPIERELLREPTKQLLQCITDTTDKKAFDKKSEDEGKIVMVQTTIILTTFATAVLL